MKNHPTSFCNAIVFFVCGLLVTCLMLPKIVRQREAARASVCSDHLKTIGLAIHNYHVSYGRLPPGTGGTTGDDDEKANNAGRLGPLVAISPFAEEQQLWQSISHAYQSPKTGEDFPPMGPVPWYDATVYQPWSEAPLIYQCPSNAPRPQAEAPRIVFTLATDGDSLAGVMTSYVACYGDGTLDTGKLLDNKDVNSVKHAQATMRGFFQAGRALRFRDMLDGLSNTVMFSETVSSVKGKPGISGIAKDVQGLSENPSLCLAAAKDAKTKWWPQGRGSRWSDGLLATSGFQTVLPPNSPSCTSDAGIFDSVVAASSRHRGGVFVLKGDGAVVFISDSIDCGDPTIAGVAIGRAGESAPGSRSPYGLWGALGTRAAAETINHEFVQANFPDQSKDQPETQETTIWRNKSGTQSLRATFVKIIDKKSIQLKDLQGVVHQVPLNSLSDTDIYRAVEMDLMKR